ncbi:hypothetical protein J41TS12_18580 [Paenibacillus antibioticophila]|uniref:Uncharacterized protein n=1 Tax=Paenibacillus antibioticophila TaxID=1274374 RepID=A0A919XUQ0_9BACL|nr:hypothetical protein [Paenibacillus antibioticophila]GIO36997.1 hypothetical protein J41TS12_18580 [Paenibacillus antibioticophila]
MDAETIMNLAPGPEMNKLVRDALAEYEESEYEQEMKWSEDNAAALELWKLIDCYCHCVCLAKLGTDIPPIISQMASIGEEGHRVTVYVGDWREALCKAFLLWENGKSGDFMHPNWEQAMKSAPERIFN